MATLLVFKNHHPLRSRHRNSEEPDDTDEYIFVKTHYFTARPAEGGTWGAEIAEVIILLTIC
jgi:hypothetical protein